MRLIGRLRNVRNQVNWIRRSSSNNWIRSLSSSSNEQWKELDFSNSEIRFLVVKSDLLMSLSYKILGETVTDAVMKNTFFGHFCAGESETTIAPVVRKLEDNGIGSILDYAAEADVIEDPDVVRRLAEKPLEDDYKTRTYEYQDEEKCDAHVETFKKCIDAVKSVSSVGFAAIKVTALGNPQLLERMSNTLIEMQNLFVKFDIDGTGYIHPDEFKAAYSTYFVGDGENSEWSKIYDAMDKSANGNIDYVQWTNSFPVEDLHLLTSNCRNEGPLSKSVLNPEEIKLVRAMRARIYDVADKAEKDGVRLMIDAEQTYYQPAIDSITWGLMRHYNKTTPVIFSTYQMYLKDSANRMWSDVKRADTGNYIFAAKMVRGAYMSGEAKYAEDKGREYPIYGTIEETHENYNSTLERAIECMSTTDNKLEIMIASHNQQSIERAVAAMRKHKLPPAKGVYFGQLLGMSDNLSFSLGNAGYKAFKYVPYGKVNEVLPYLIRRAHENADALGGAKKELDMSIGELKRRMFGNSDK